LSGNTGGLLYSETDYQSIVKYKPNILIVACIRISETIILL